MPSRPGGRERAGKTSGKTSKAQEDRPGNGTNADWHFSTAPAKMEVLSEQDVKRMMLPGARAAAAKPAFGPVHAICGAARLRAFFGADARPARADLRAALRARGLTPAGGIEALRRTCPLRFTLRRPLS